MESWALYIKTAINSTTMTSNKIGKIKELGKKLSLSFKNFNLFQNAFVHRSYLNENPGFTLPNNERLEFLGDAVLELVVTKYLFEKFPNPEGELTALRSALVRGKNLSEISIELGVFECLYLSSGEEKGSDKARGLILANCLEAIIGAIYLDSGFDSAKVFIEINIINRKIESILDDKLYIDPKSEFQEIVQELHKVTPIYRIISESGPDHDKAFISGAYIEDKLIAKGMGSSKSISEQEAAKEALKTIEN